MVVVSHFSRFIGSPTFPSLNSRKKIAMNKTEYPVAYTMYKNISMLSTYHSDFHLPTLCLLCERIQRIRYSFFIIQYVPLFASCYYSSSLIEIQSLEIFSFIFWFLGFFLHEMKDKNNIHIWLFPIFFMYFFMLIRPIWTHTIQNLIRFNR